MEDREILSYALYCAEKRQWDTEPMTLAEYEDLRARSSGLARTNDRIADACLAALRERGRTIAPDKATIPMMCAGNDVIQELQTRSICSAEVYERMLAVAPKG